MLQAQPEAKKAMSWLFSQAKGFAAGIMGTHVDNIETMKQALHAEARADASNADASNAPHSKRALAHTMLSLSVGSSALDGHMLKPRPVRTITKGEKSYRRQDASGPL